MSDEIEINFHWKSVIRDGGMFVEESINGVIEREYGPMKSGEVADFIAERKHVLGGIFSRVCGDDWNG